MATPQNGKPEPSRIIGSISKLVGVLVGTVVVTGKRIIGLVTPPGEGPSDKHRKKTMQAPAKRKKKAVRKTEIKIPKTKKKKKKVVKRKGTGSSGDLLPQKRKAQHPRKRRHTAKKRRLQTVKGRAIPRMV